MARQLLNKCPTRRLPTNPGVSLGCAAGLRISATKSGAVKTAAATALPDGFWLTDLPYSDVRLIGDKHVNRIICSDGWIGAPWKRFKDEFGLAESCTAEQAQALAEMAERIIRLSVHAVTRTEFWKSSGERIGDRRTFGRASLATGLSDFIRPQLIRSRTRDLYLAQPSRTLLRFGIGSWEHKPAADCWILTAHRPRFSYLRWLASQPMPGGYSWNRISIQQPKARLTDELEQQFEGIGRSVILSGEYQPFGLGGPFWMRSWLRGMEPGLPRNWFTLSEAKALRRCGEIFLDEALCGPKWRKAAEAALGACAKGLAGACGGTGAARNSWSAGLAAENLIRAVCGGIRQRNAPVPMEKVWVAMHDRVAAIGPIEAAEAAGGQVTAAVAGSITVHVQGGAEQAAAVAAALWREGLFLPAGAAARLKRAGVNLLSDAGEFGGEKADRTFAVGSQLGLCGLIRKLDAVADDKSSRTGFNSSDLQAALARLQA